MKITFTRGTALGGIGNDCYPGDVRDLPDAQAQSLIAQGRAVAGDSSPKKPSAKPAAKAAPATPAATPEST
jgi:hypothetical protein